MPKNGKPNSPKSPSSVQSIGMGEKAATSPNGKLTADLPRPLPEGILESAEPVYDCVVYLIYCPSHENIAVTNAAKCKCVWLPFVPLPEGETWNKASHDGVDMIIGRNDPEMEADDAEKTAPIYKMNYLHILRLQLPSRRVVQRLCQFIYLEANPNFQCCRNTDRVNWIPVGDIHQGRVAKVWGPELKILTTMLASQQPQIVSEFTTRNALYYLHLKGSKQQELLVKGGLAEGQVTELYTFYVEHCYPSFYMCTESFRVAFLKFGLAYDPVTINRLFNAFRLTEEKRSFLDFHEFLIGIVALEPNCSNKLDARTQFIFKYYDYEKKGYLNNNDIYCLLKDTHKSWPEAKLQEETRQYTKSKATLSYEDFLTHFKTKLSSVMYELCRAQDSLMALIGTFVSRKKKERHRQKITCQGLLRAKRVTKGTCWSCRAQQYEYASNFITFDTLGRAVEPSILQVMPPPSSKYSKARSRYSLEHVFSVASVPNIFIDLIRDFHARRLVSEARVVGLMSVPQEWYIFSKYLRILCNELGHLLDSETKLVKVNAPAVVIGDLQGGLNDLMYLEKLFWQSFPVVPDNLIFLGNYSGKAGFGIECLIYLFALKLCSPNKVFLLRGAYEMGANTAEALSKEGTRKFGADHGKIILNIFLQIFAKLPVAILVDDNILATHSGIPTSSRLEGMSKIPKDMPSVHRDSPLAYEMISRYPKGESGSADSIGGKSTKSLHGAAAVAPQRDANVSRALFGAKVGDSRFYTDFKSSGRKAKSGQSQSGAPKSTGKSVKSLKVKSTPVAAQKSGKSLKSSKSLRTKSDKSRKSLKSLKTKSGKQVNPSLPKPNSLCSTKSGKSTKSSGAPKSVSPPINKTKSGGADRIMFNIPKAGAKLRPTFLSARKVRRKSVKFKTLPSKSDRSRKSGSSKGFPDSKKKPSSVSSSSRGSNETTFDRRELASFLKANELTCLLRSASPCKLGFKIRFSQQCLTVFSASNYESGNEGAVAYIDGSSYSVRFLRYSTAPNTTPPPATTNQK